MGGKGILYPCKIWQRRSVEQGVDLVCGSLWRVIQGIVALDVAPLQGDKMNIHPYESRMMGLVELALVLALLLELLMRKPFPRCYVLSAFSQELTPFCQSRKVLNSRIFSFQSNVRATRLGSVVLVVHPTV